MLRYVSDSIIAELGLLFETKVSPSLTSSAIAEIDDGPHDARTLHKVSTISVNFIKTYLM